MVLRLVPYVLGLTVIVLALWFLDRHALKTVDWGLLATFAAFFTFSGNLARLESVRVLFARLLSHGTMLVSALTCQIISNVPAAILLSRFTQDARVLLVGVNVGGAGTLVASLANPLLFWKNPRGAPRRGGVLFFFFWGVFVCFWRFFWLVVFGWGVRSLLVTICGVGACCFSVDGEAGGGGAGPGTGAGKERGKREKQQK